MRDSISEMLESLKWPTLKQCRKCVQLTLLYKIVHKFVEIPTEHLPVFSPIAMTRSNHDLKFLHYYTSIDNHFFPEQYLNGMICHKTSSINLQLTVSNTHYSVIFVHISTRAPIGPC